MSKIYKYIAEIEVDVECFKEDLLENYDIVVEDTLNSMRKIRAGFSAEITIKTTDMESTPEEIVEEFLYTTGGLDNVENLEVVDDRLIGD